MSQADGEPIGRRVGRPANDTSLECEALRKELKAFKDALREMLAHAVKLRAGLLVAKDMDLEHRRVVYAKAVVTEFDIWRVSIKETKT